MKTSLEKRSKPSAKTSATPKQPRKPSINKVESGLKDEDLENVTGGWTQIEMKPQ